MHDEQLSALTVLQQTANHLGLILPDKKEREKSTRDSQQAVARTAFKGNEHLLNAENAFLKMSDPEICCKMKVLAEMMKTFQPADKILLFSYSVKLLDLLEAVVKVWALNYSRLDGTGLVFMTGFTHTPKRGMQFL